MRARKQSGLSLVEMLISSMIFAGILVIVLPVTGVVRSNLSVNRRQGDLRERVQLATSRVAAYLRPASLATVRVNVSGSWVVPAESTSYTSIQFQALAGYPYGAAPVLGPVRSLRFRMDSTELPNAVDDDRDGVADEGGIYLEDSGSSVELCENIEQFRVMKTGRTLVFTIQCAGRNSEGGIHRSRFDQTVILRNN